MGAEDFQVELVGADELSILEHLARMPKTASVGTRIDRQFEYRDGNHIIEMEVRARDSEGRLSCRFALCQPNSVDEVFSAVVSGLSSALGLTVHILDETPSAYRDRYEATQLDGLSDAMSAGIKRKRRYWRADFSGETAVVTCAEAVARFMLPAT